MAVDPDDWTGAVDTQRREGRLFIVLLVALVLVLVPFAIWFAVWYSEAVIGLD